MNNLSAAPWRMFVSLGQRAYTIASRGRVVAVVERVEDARLIVQAPKLFALVEALAMDLEHCAETAATPYQQRYLREGITAARATLDEIRGVRRG